MPHKQMGHIVRKYIREKRVKGAALLLLNKNSQAGNISFN